MASQDKTTQDSDIESLFLLGSGRIDQALKRVRLAHGARLRVARVAALSAAVTWLPLLVLAAVEGLAWGDRVAVPLLKDFLPYGQFLLADFGALYENARRMRPVPLELQHIFALVLAAVLPFLPLVFLVVPAQTVFRKLVKLLM
jgi:hypothetical protein